MTPCLGFGPASSSWPSQGTAGQSLTLNTASRHDPDSGPLPTSQLASPEGPACPYCSPETPLFPPTALKILPFLAKTWGLHSCSLSSYLTPASSFGNHRCCSPSHLSSFSSVMNALSRKAEDNLEKRPPPTLMDKTVPLTFESTLLKM